MHTFAGVAFPKANFLLVALKTILFGAFMRCNAPDATIDTAQCLLLQCIPRDIRTVLRVLHLDPDIVRYACCPKCFAIYAPDNDPLKADDPYPHTCSHVHASGDTCGAALVVEERQAPKRKKDPPRIVFKPICVFPYRTLVSWLKVFLSRPEIEKLLETSWTSTAPSGEWHDIKDAPAIREFRGPDGKTLFSVQRNGSLHLVFSLFVDWFNPYGNKKAGKSHSMGAMYMACLNLPIDVRYAPENIYLAGIIPGPREPSVEEINHLLAPLVDELLKLWTHGMYLTRTALRWMGRLVRVAMIPLVCDLPALRKTAGFAGHSASQFCSFCRLLKININNIDRQTWPPSRTWAEHLRLAEEWRDGDAATRKDVFDNHGLCWSELLRLPYWDPTRFAIVDVMHNLFLGELRHHCMEVWGIDIKDKPPSGQKTRPHTPEEQERELGKAVRALRKGSKTALEKLRKGYIVAIAKLNDVLLEDKKLTKASYIKSLLKWANTIDDDHPIKTPTVLDHDTTDFHLQAEGPTDVSKYRVLSYDILQVVRRDIASTYLPSWLQRPPSNFGSPSHGKLKADQWRTVCTVNLVITLVRLWSSPNASQNDKDLLENFLHLVSAVDLASRRSMSQERAAAYDEHMYLYLRGLRELFDQQFVSNHHLSLHLYECLVLFGAVHGWWAFPFERYNGLIQQIDTNNKPADMPLTFLRYFYIGANLRALVPSMKWPDNPEYKELMETYRQAFGEATYGTRVVDALAFGFGTATAGPGATEYDAERQEPLPVPVYDAILQLINATGQEQFTSAHGSHTSTRNRPSLSPFGQPVGSVTSRNVNFSTREKGLRNSFVIFHDAQSPVGLQHRAGQVAQIYLHSRTRAGKALVEPFLVIDAYERLTEEDAAKDPYRRWPDIHTQLYYNRFQARPSVVRIEDVKSHFAAYMYRPEDIGHDCVVARDLDRT